MRAIGASFLDFTFEYVNPLIYAYRVSGLSVRCVQALIIMILFSTFVVDIRYLIRSIARHQLAIA